MATDTRPDAELVTAWVAGDQSAFAAVYDRYADALFAFAVSRLHDRTAAADAVQDTFLRAARRVEQLRDGTRLRAWLYAIARNQVIDEVRRPPLLATTELDDMTSDDRDPADMAAAHDAAALVRDAALGLNERDQELLDLHLRHGLDGADLADVAGLSRPQTYVAMNRLRARLAKAVGVVLVARHGSRDCAGLAQVLHGWDGRFTLDMRSRVTRHVEGCPACSDQRTRLVGAVQLSAGALGLPLALAPKLLRGRTIARVAEVRPPPGAGSPSPDGTLVDGASDAPSADASTTGNGAPTHPGASGDGPPVSEIGAQSDATGVHKPRATESVGSDATDDDGLPATELVMSNGTRAHMWRRDGFPVVSDRAGRRRIAVFVAAAALVVVLFGGLALSRRGGGLEANAAGSAPRPAATTVVTSPSPASTVTPETTATTTSSTTVAPTIAPASDVETATSVAESLPAATEPHEPGVAAADDSTPDPPSPPSDDPAPIDNPAPEEQTLPPDPPPAADTTLVAPPQPPPPTPDPGHITVLSGPITLGTSTGGTVRIRNDGGQAAAWSASAGNGAFGVSPAGGSLEPGQETDIAVGVDRAALPEGATTTAVTVGADNGGGSVDLTATVERPPVITAFGRTPPMVRTSGSCGPTLASVSVTATDESPIASVAVQWSSDGTFAQLTDLVPNGAGAFTGQIGSFTSTGSHTLKAMVTDARGNIASQTTSVNVMSC